MDLYREEKAAGVLHSRPILGAAAQGAVPENGDKRTRKARSCVRRLTNPRAGSLKDLSCIWYME